MQTCALDRDGFRQTGRAMIRLAKVDEVRERNFEMEGNREIAFIFRLRTRAHERARMRTREQERPG